MGKLFFDITSKRNQVWASIQTEKWRKSQIPVDDKEEDTLPFITISRQYGCTGFSLGEMLAAELNGHQSTDDLPWAVYDKKLYEEIENADGIPQALLNSLTEKTKDEISDFFASFVTISPSQSTYYHKVFNSMRALAHKGKTIMIGRGASVATAGLDMGFHIRLYAPEDWRVQKILRLHDLKSEKAARDLLKKVNKDREHFVKKFLKQNVNDPTLYHIMLNNAEFSIEDCVKIIIEAMEKKGIVSHMGFAG